MLDSQLRRLKSSESDAKPLRTGSIARVVTDLMMYGVDQQIPGQCLQPSRASESKAVG